MDTQRYAPIVVRIGLGLVFLSFGIDQLVRPETWFGYLPEWATFAAPGTLILLNGILDTLLGALLIAGLLTRIVAIVGTLHLLGIATSLGYNDVAIRDIGLALACAAIALHGPDPWSVDARWHA